ncbi:DSBA oxidoreductase [Ferroglobus placidus DSM 10642]|uniref:DSBA oxidoreductase n=1 Tax=Ferroglobus placidus (strain DSM 10642 / AEDII12DO) TaxID=589924 RepID=D3S3C0_FERPA|nr:DsbA family protein [Ferroglobus placidus]ADC64753.1 DSBA oxidoreductase [Ferroglobus placidus DSM 10642]
MRMWILVVLGLVAGIAAGYAAGVMVGMGGKQVCTWNAGSGTGTAISEQQLNKTVEKVVKTLQSLIPVNVSVRATKVEPYGKLYLLNLEFYNKSGVIATQQMFMVGNGSMLLSSSPSCAVNISELSARAQQTPSAQAAVNVSADDDPWRGNESASVVIIEFSDYACPYCAEFANDVEPKILDNYGDRVKIVFRDFPVHGEISYLAAEAADCAGEQGVKEGQGWSKYWEYHDLLFANQQEWIENTTKLYDYAKQIGLNTTAFKACLDSGKYRSEVEKDLQDGRNYGVTGTPTFFINGQKVEGLTPYEVFARFIEQELK